MLAKCDLSPKYKQSHTCTTIIKPQIMSIPLFPRVVKKSWPIGRGSLVASISETGEVAKDAAIRRIHPRPAVPATPIRIASGAARAAPATSSVTRLIHGQEGEMSGDACLKHGKQSRLG